MTERASILLLGGRGQLGWELRDTLAPLGRVVALGRDELDLTDLGAIRRAVEEAAPTIIVNAAAHTAVDKAESEPELAETVNGTAPGVLAEEAKRRGALLVHYSTDYVFDGTKRAPYEEDDPPNPRSAYGRSKLRGERAVQEVDGAHLILRTSWVYGLRGKNFLLTILRLARERDELRVVDDQTGAPTWSRMIAETTALMLAVGCGHAREAKGIYHLTAAGSTTWHGFAAAILQHMAEPLAVRRLTAISTAEYPTPAARPAYSVLSNQKLERDFGLALPHWYDSLQRVLER